ncbi:response regulator [uncultured Devosia sp.]|uniref:response regulator n=1 Tax=uncultured Devosia sp. TaxID=211434 RepID=UPI0035C9EC45
MTKPRILVVDDEPQIQRFLRPALIAVDYEVIEAGTAAEAKRLIATRAPDVVVLDLGLPDSDGKAVIADVRAWSQVPIIVLSARDRESEKIDALDLGANDYVEKPFGIGELLARIRTALRHRADSPADPIITIADLRIDTSRHAVTKGEIHIHLTPKEYDLLTLLAANPGRVMTHRQILAQVWGAAHVEDVQYLRVLIGQLREKIEPAQGAPRFILNEPGVGYRLAEK